MAYNDKIHGARYSDESGEVYVGMYLSNDVSGESYDRVGMNVSTMVGITNELDDNFTSKAFMSLDGLMRPISMDGDGGLPRYVQYDVDALDCSGIAECRTLDDLNPFTNPSGLSRSKVATERSDTPNVGHDIDIIGRTSTDAIENGVPEGGMIMPIAGSKNGDTFIADYKDDVRAMALRGPIIIAAWGYHPDGSPVPNKNDVESNCRDGIFVNPSTPSGLDKEKFLDGHLHKSATWPVAALDLRLNTECGTWQAFSCNGVDRLSPLTLDEALPGSGHAMAHIPPSGQSVTVSNTTGKSFVDGTFILARRTYGCDYEFLYAADQTVNISGGGGLDCSEIANWNPSLAQVLIHLPGESCKWSTIDNGCP